MSSQRRIDSSRANGALSRGPKSPEALARSRAAALTHGLAARSVVIPGESETRFRAFRDACIAELQPATPLELDVVDQFVAARWRLTRIRSIEAGLLDLEMGRNRPAIEAEFDSCGREIRIALAFRSLCEKSTVLAVLNRYEIHFCRDVANPPLLVFRSSHRNACAGQSHHRPPSAGCEWFFPRLARPAGPPFLSSRPPSGRAAQAEFGRRAARLPGRSPMRAMDLVQQRQSVSDRTSTIPGWAPDVPHPRLRTDPPATSMVWAFCGQLADLVAGHKPTCGE